MRGGKDGEMTRNKRKLLIFNVSHLKWIYFVDNSFFVVVKIHFFQIQVELLFIFYCRKLILLFEKSNFGCKFNPGSMLNPFLEN